jgi:HTH-type transcriptional regulator/antitoxin HigA
MPTKTVRHAVGDLYLNLIREFPLRPLRSEADLDDAIAVIDGLVDRGALAPEQRDYLDVLSGLVESYEDRHDPLPDLPGVDALRYLIEENGLSQSQLSRETNIPEATLSEILSGKRGISPKVRGILAGRFKVDPALFI